MTRRRYASLLGFFTTLLSASFASARLAPQPNDHDGWTGIITTHSTSVANVRKPARYYSNNGKKDVVVILNPDGSVTSEATYYVEEAQSVSEPRSEQHNVDIGKGSGDPDANPNISLDGNDHFLINVQHLNMSVSGRRTGWFNNHDPNGGKRTWDDVTTFAVSPTDVTDVNSKPGDRHLDGSKTFVEPGDDDGKTENRTTVEWHLSYKEDLRLIVTIDKYDEWQPQATTSETSRGNTMHLHAKLQKKDGTPSPEKADYFLFELVDTSAVPGVAINFPAKATGSTPKKDLRFETGDSNPDMDIQGEDGQTAKTKATQLLEADAVISCFDWGAYGKVRVSAQVGNHRVFGYLEQDPSMAQIRIPRRAEKSIIADAWKKTHGIAADIPDNADTDDSPKSNVLDGDGLSLYEEYRGFYEKGEHKQGDPKTKDVFVRDKSNGKCAAGLALAAKISDLAIHYQFTAEEFPEDRIINFNFDPLAHAVDQHGIFIRKDDTYGDSEAQGRLRCPAEVLGEVVIHAINPAVRGQAGSTAEFTVTVAHEFLHCVGVDHHGGGDPALVQWQRATNGTIKEFTVTTENNPDGSSRIAPRVGVEITVLDENLAPMTDAQLDAALNFPCNLYVAKEKNGEHAGDVSCVMRYNCCNAYIKGEKRVLVRTLEALGEGLCTQAKGTQFNAPDARGDSRHGEGSKGNCKGQIVVNDKRAQQPTH